MQQQPNEGFVCVVLQIFPAVLRALKSGAARLALTQELGDQVKGNKAMLEHQQFELVVKLLNCALLVSFSIAFVIKRYLPSLLVEVELHSLGLK